MAYDQGQLDALVQNLQNQVQKPQGVLGQLDPLKLALAQGFFAPTKTGGFGESVSNALGAIQAPLKTMADQNSNIQDKILQIKMAQAKLAGGSSEDREDRRDARLELTHKLHAIDSDIRGAQLGLRGLEVGSPEHSAAMAEIQRLQAERNALVNRTPAGQPRQTQQPQQTQLPQNPAVGQEFTFRGGQVGVWNGTAWVPKGQ